MGIGRRAALAAASLALVAGLAAWAFADSGSGLDFYSKLPSDELAPKLAARMTAEEALGQVFMFGYPKSSADPVTLSYIADRGLGGVKVFGWNAQDTREVARAVRDFQAAAARTRLKVPLLVATDQEGGWVRHVKGSSSETPGNMAIGASGRSLDAYYSGYYIGRELRALGINMNFAPVVDLYTNKASYLIGSRAFSDDAGFAGYLAAAFCKGSEKAGVLCTAKHFPGHGATENDSHGTLPRIYIDGKTLRNRELVPYKTLIAEGLDALMSGHLAFPLVSGDQTPASLSSFFIGGMLRKELGFKGLVITDDLFMEGAIQDAGSVNAACVKAILAGNDMVLVSYPSTLDPSLLSSLASRMKSDKAFDARVREAATRVLHAKLKYLRRDDAVPISPDPDKVSELVPDREGRSFYLELACRSLTNLMPSRAVPDPSLFKGRVLLAGSFKEFIEEGKRAFPRAQSLYFSYSPGSAPLASEYASFSQALGSCDVAVVCVSNASDLPYLNLAVSRGVKTVVVSVLTPVCITSTKGLSAAVAAYSYSLESFQAAFAFLAGKIDAKGVLPYER
jgi:beta-N-acetylhexosaminidase